MSKRQIQVAEEIAKLAASFFARESNRQSLITVIRASIAPNFAQATIYFTVLPQNDEERALAFAKRNRTDFRSYVKSHARLKNIPRFEFAIDEGEKHRQRLDELSAEA